MIQNISKYNSRFIVSTPHSIRAFCVLFSDRCNFFLGFRRVCQCTRLLFAYCISTEGMKFTTNNNINGIYSADGFTAGNNNNSIKKMRNVTHIMRYVYVLRNSEAIKWGL